jgi:hypothetical protein
MLFIIIYIISQYSHHFNSYGIDLIVLDKYNNSSSIPKIIPLTRSKVYMFTAMNMDWKWCFYFLKSCVSYDDMQY